MPKPFLTIDDRQIVNLERELRIFTKKGVPFATRNALNNAVFFGRKIAVKTIKKKMVLRNTFAVRSVRVEKTTSLTIGQQKSKLGSVEDFMADQEFGAVKSKRGKKGVRITTSFAAGQGMQARPRTRVARGSNKISKIKLNRNSRKGKNRKQRNIIAIAVAAKSSSKFVYLDLGDRQGIFKVLGKGGRFKGKSRRGQSKLRIKMVHDLSNDSVVIPKNPWLAPTTNTVIRWLPRMYFNELKKQADFHFKGFKRVS